MALYRRGKVWWYHFQFQGASIQESARTGSKTIAREAERNRRRELEASAAGVVKRERPVLFKQAANEWLLQKAAT